MRQDALGGSRGIAWNHKSFRKECAEERRQEVEEIDDSDSPRFGGAAGLYDLFHMGKFPLLVSVWPFHLDRAVGDPGMHRLANVIEKVISVAVEHLVAISIDKGAI